MKIHVLKSEVIDQIAAGEVVERPAQIIKELVENSLDAGATEIEVDFAQGGRYVKVVDNGSGIGKEDLSLAFLRFATSKIQDADDLWKLGTFGFRGEALASIGSVSKITLMSNTSSPSSTSRQDAQAYRIHCDFGKISSCETTSRSQGTTIVVEELFANTPARLKFMKTEKGEVAQIKIILKAMALAYPEVEFRVYTNGELQTLYPKAQTHLERTQAVLEMKPLYKGTAVRGGVRCEAYFADPNHTAKTSKNIWLFAQKRYIQDRSLNAAVTEAYRNLLMHGEFPIAACFIETAPDDIDVNIHPTKSQVKFAQPSEAFRAVQASLRETLEQAPWLQELHSKTAYYNKIPNFKESTTDFKESTTEDLSVQAAPVSNLSFEAPEFLQTHFKQKVSPLTENRTEMTEKTLVAAAVAANRATGATPYWTLLEVLAQANQTYLLCQSHKGLVIIDQHAAHERVMFERLMAKWKGGQVEVQQFLFPVSIDLSEEKVEALMLNAAQFFRLGLELEALGPSTIGIKALPLLIKESVVAQELERIATALVNQGDTFSFEKIISDVCARLACHSAIRAGQSLSVMEMKGLLEQMDDYPQSTFCPHGRPVYVEYPFAKLEKDFGRIL
jgi:DNA mismatch repair protein MutL